MVKIPGTAEGIPAIEHCLTEGININITLLFSVERYAEVIEAFLKAFEARVAKGQPVDRLCSVASFFVSRVDTKVDPQLDSQFMGDGASAPTELAAIRGARSRSPTRAMAYRLFETTLASEAVEEARGQGSKPAAPSLGLDQHEGPDVSRCLLRRGAHRPAHGEHDAARDL